MTISLWLDTQTEKPKEEFDVLIVGAGVMGAAAAYWLSLRQGLKIAVIDTSRQAAGASGRNGGMVLRGVMSYYNKAVKTHGRDTARWILKFNEQTQAHLADFSNTYGNNFSFEKCGSYLLAASLEELQDLSESAQLMKEDGFDVEYIKDDPIDRGFYGALYNPCDIGLNPVKLVSALLQTSKATVYESEQVFRINASDNKTVLHTQKRILSAAKILLCTNAFLPLLLPEFQNILRPVRGQILVTRPLKERVLEKICFANFGYEYFRQLPDGRFLLGGSREPFIEEETSYADMVTANVQGALRNYLKDKFPELAGEGIDYKWSGTMCFTQDGLPVLGELEDKSDVYFVSGCNGHGMGYSMALSKMLVECALDGASPGIFNSQRLLLSKSATK